MHTLLRYIRTRRGFATIATAIIMTLVFAFVVILLDTVLAARRVSRTHQAVLAADQIAEAGLQKAIFCFNSTDNAKCGGIAGVTYPGESNISFGSGSFTTTVTGSGSIRTVTSTGTLATGERRVVQTDITSIPPENSMNFSYALQSGEGGAHLENNSSISGTIYSNGDVDCQSTQANITGDAYSSKVSGKIEKCHVGFHAHADKILNSNVDGDAYYNVNPTDIAGTTVLGTKYASQTRPISTVLPALDLDFWHDSAEAGGIIYGDYHPADNSDLGPVKIVGNLIMDNNVDVTIQGPVWVVGDITTGNNSSFTLASGFGEYSSTILADDPSDYTRGKIDITNNTGINGSGNAKSHILFATTCNKTSDTDPALSVANNASGAVFYALSGTMRLQSNAGAKSLAGYRLFLDQNAIVTYVESDFTGDFSNSPGGIWHVDDGTWREKP
ncbi:MAG TPA: hypothetical protein VL500_02160 [Candidatus Eisenbacteria bacterium]|jgi:hypothetical protein|nr:hypothetical protein [Candidatus Eisenbacteria bacterium]